jgi:hypothetical protein
MEAQMAFMQQIPHDTHQVIFWVGWFLCLLFFISSLVLWYHNLILCWLMIPVGGMFLLEILELQLTRSWLGLISWFLFLTTAAIIWMQHEYSWYKWRNKT